MDRSRYKRLQAQSQRHTQQKNYGNSATVPLVISARPKIAPASLRQTAPRLGRTQTIATPAAVRIHTVAAATIVPNAVAASRTLIDGFAAPVRKAPQPTNFIQQAAPIFAVETVQTAVAENAQIQPPAVPATAVKKFGLPPIDMNLPGEDSPSLFSRFKSRKNRRLAFRGMAIGMILVMTTGGLLASQTIFKANKVFRGSTATVEALKEEVKPDLLDGEGSGRINVLLLGKGGGGHTAPDLTDTIILASIDPVNKTSTLFSIPRDLWVTVPNQGVMKLNAAWEKGVLSKGTGRNKSTDPAAVKAGFALVDETIGEALGIKINYNMIVNFDAFKQAVDNVGGVNVTVPSDLIDPTIAWENANDPAIAKAGDQVMDGRKALLYARSRATTSDFARSERQRALMLGLKDKIVSAGTLSNPLKLSGLLNTFGDNVQTDLSIKQVARLYELTKDITPAQTTSLDLATAANPLVTTGNLNGQSVVLPKAGLFKYDAIQAFVRGQLKDPYIVKENARIMVLNGTTLAGLATLKSDELKGYGYNVTTTANAPTSGWTQTTIVDMSKGKRNKYTKNFLEQRYDIKVRNTLPDDTIATNSADFVIIIGSNEVPTTQTQTR